MRELVNYLPTGGVDITEEGTMSTAFEPYKLGALTLKNRIVMAPMTRRRAIGVGQSPTEAMATYYSQRAGAGLIVTEGTQPSAIGQGYPDTPGLHSEEQIAAWRVVTDAVHASGGVIFAQLMHVGRLSHPDLLGGGMRPVGASPVAAKGQLNTGGGHQPYPEPEELTDTLVLATIADHAQAARNAIKAGFDGVELHGANGYLIQQFLSSNTNHRTDRWGGSAERRARFGIEVAKAVADAIGAERVGFRISPGGTLNDISETDTADVYRYLVEGLAELDLVYLHAMEMPGQRPHIEQARQLWPNTFILNPATYPNPTGPGELQLIGDGLADLISFGALFISNPDLPKRLAVGGPFAAPDMSKAYGGGEAGYIDYPSLEDATA